MVNQLIGWRRRLMPYFTSPDGVKIYYDLMGSGEKTVVFLNGIAMTTLGWRLQAEYLRNLGFQVLLHDMRGQGMSDKPRSGYSIERHASDLKGLLEHLGIGRCVLVGISYGGKVALAASKMFPDAVEKLVVLNSSHAVDRALISRTDRWILAARLKSGRFLWQTMIPDIFSDEFLNNNFSFVASLAPNFELIDFVAFEEMIKAFLRLDLRGKLTELSIPTLIVAGTDDRVFPPRYSKMIHEDLPAGNYVEVKSGHVSIWEKPNEINSIIYNFLRSEGK
jgi:3-oxoadipate enol-lactonase